MDLTSPWLPPEDGTRLQSSRTAMRCIRLLLRCTSAAELLGTVLSEGPAWITGEGSALYLLDGDGMLRLAASHGLVEDRSEDYDESVQRMLGGLELWNRRSDESAPDGTGSGLERLADLLTLNVTERNSRPDDVALLLLHRAQSINSSPTC